MTLYLRLKIKDMLTTPELLGWGIGFIEFWVLMWIFVFSQISAGTAWKIYVIKTNITMAYSFLGLLSMSSVAAGLSYSLFYASRAARYLTKFTRIGIVRFIVEDFLGSLVAILIFALAIFLSVIGFSYTKWGILALPENPIGVIVDLIIAGVALYWLAYMITLAVIVSRRTKALTMVSYIPLLIGFIAYSQLWIDLGKLAYLMPLCSLPALLTYHGIGAYPPTGAYFAWLTGDKLLPAINLRLAAISVFAWTIIFIILSLILLRKSKGIPIEEIRL
ncbi:MAG TPA: hypothetical protein ENG65_02365 [Candidatus Bathyarchaeota archaeon]|nr:hypothetical protein [Candidatus Bathyarchaeota archaeon]